MWPEPGAGQSERIVSPLEFFFSLCTCDNFRGEIQWRRSLAGRDPKDAEHDRRHRDQIAFKCDRKHCVCLTRCMEKNRAAQQGGNQFAAGRAGIAHRELRSGVPGAMRGGRAMLVPEAALHGAIGPRRCQRKARYGHANQHQQREQYSQCERRFQRFQ